MDINYYVENSDKNSLDYNRIHALRFYRSYSWIEQYLKEDLKVLELGAPGLFSYIIKDLYPSIKIANTTKDLRYEFDLPSNHFDLILNMEIIEHIKDREPTDFQDFHELAVFSMTGLQSFFSECNRVLKSDGLMFLTTPNINSWQAIYRMLNYLPPLNYYPHVREYSIGELVNWSEQHGFEVLYLETYDNYGEPQAGCRLAIQSILSEKGFSTQYRGDTIFLLLKKVKHQVSQGDNSLDVSLKDINLIIFPDWSQSEDTLYPELERVLKVLATHPDKNKIALLIDIRDIAEEEAKLVLSGVVMNLLMQENLDITDELEVSLLKSLSKTQWELLLPRLQSRIILENENKQIISQLQAEKICSLTLKNFSN
jgi:SAM-dependent methyltransferase